MTAQVAPRRGRPRDEAIDAAIIEATIAELLERGFLAASMESIAARAGIAKTTLYRRWPNTTELAVAALKTFETETELEPPDLPPREQLIWLLDRMRHKWGNPRYAAILRRVIGEADSSPERYLTARDRLIGRQIELMNAALQACADAGLIPAGVDLERVRRLLVSPIMTAALTLKSTLTQDEVVTNVDIVLRGLAP